MLLQRHKLTHVQLRKPNIVFDLGNVLIHCDLDAGARMLSSKSSLSADTIRDRLFTSQVIDPFDAGALDGNSFTMLVQQLIGWSGERDELESIWQQMLRPDPAMFQLYDELLAAGHGTYILSNANPFHTDFVLTEHPAIGRAHGRIFSCECKLIKPDERIFRHLAEEYRIAPEESIFIDDRADNTAAAARVGFHAITHFTVEDTRTRLSELLNVLA